MSLPVATTITGIDTPEALRQALKVAQGFSPMPRAEMRARRDGCLQYAGDGRFRAVQGVAQFDNPEARIPHRFPLDTQSVEVKEMLKSTENNGHPYPSVK